MPSPTSPPTKVVWVGVSEGGDPLCPHAFSRQLSWQREYKIPKYNKPSKRDGKDKKKYMRWLQGPCAGAQLAARMCIVCLVAFKVSCLLWCCGAFLHPPPLFFWVWYGVESQKGVIPYALMDFHAS